MPVHHAASLVAVLVAVALALPGGAGAAVPIAEPDDSPSAATGPLQPGVAYTGQTDSNTDEDWLYISAGPGAAQVTVSVSQSARGTCTDDADGAFATLYGANPGVSDPLGQAMGAGAGAAKQFTVAVTGPATYWLSVGTSCAPGAPWQVQVDSTGTLTSAPAGDPSAVAPPSPTGSPAASSPSMKSPARCARARRSTRRWEGYVAAHRRALRRTRDARARRLLRRILTLERTTLRHVRARAALTC
ncbi:hypothetical protein FSW04_17585 [Baekduia soli]|uniref:Peptidase C-terminal archaeal/bacterial domain-containing protein n=1 Tax=Baekduia soli TaxID=496014 RepID=A0A5B8U866_9ACTN|nr:hypothetical protein [Baekduia soli]QEC49210.1 hypothetical protein FSW04_17585 [Baekduia soli]